LVMAIRDNGRGIDHNEVDMSHSFGLLGMQERAGALGGSLKIDSKSGDGTRLVLNMPLDRL
ncbi:MAG: ATP-binding protein, partial [Gammaproteobacteria bacterium]